MTLITINFKVEIKKIISIFNKKSIFKMINKNMDKKNKVFNQQNNHNL